MTAPTMTAPAPALTVTAKQLWDLLPKTLIGLRQVSLQQKPHATSGGIVREFSADYAVLGGGRGSVGILDYGLSANKQRGWVPISKGNAIWPYVGEIVMTDENVAGRPAKLLSPDGMDARRLIVRASERFDVVFSVAPKSSSDQTAGAVGLAELRNVAEQFEWARLDAFNHASAAYGF